MQRLKISLPPEFAADSAAIRRCVALEAGIAKNFSINIRKRSIDARGKNPSVILDLEIYDDEPTPHPSRHTDKLRYVNDQSPSIVIVGAGPAGYFAAIELLEHGIKPIVIDRGKNVRERRRDLRALQQFSIVNPHSNYCFGDGGAGAYSDGKLYTKSTKRGNIYKTLELLVEHGANSEILIDAHPHIGSNKLPKVVGSLRETILSHGGEVHFNQFVTGFVKSNGRIIGASTLQGSEFIGKGLILAAGHSARDIFNLLYSSGIHIEPKPFALGVRAEHPQALIDELRYKQRPRNPFLPSASYKLAAQINGRGVFSFCMCPGGLIVPAATSSGEIVVNGMSMSRRDSRFANSGIVVSVEIADAAKHSKRSDYKSCIEYQQSVERKVFELGDGSQQAPAQRLTDFISGKISNSLPETSYIPGIYPSDISSVFDTETANRLRLGFIEFDRMMKGFLTAEAIVTATESRTSSPIRIPRLPDSCEHPTAPGLFPCGEGAGYAGGIMSAALDGQRVASALANIIS